MNRKKLISWYDTEHLCDSCGRSFLPDRDKTISTWCNDCRVGEYWYPRICVNCGVEFLSRKRDTMYCSGKCNRQYRSKIKGWEFHERQWENLRELVLERDNYTCQECHAFSMNGFLQVHHIKPLFRGGVNDETNLVALCPTCHKTAHRKYNFP